MQQNQKKNHSGLYTTTLSCSIHKMPFRINGDFSKWQ